MAPPASAGFPGTTSCWTTVRSRADTRRSPGPPRGFRLRDLDSTNGTRVNDHRITDTLLFRNDQIVFGDLPAVFEGDDAPVRQEQAKSPAAPAAIAPAAAAPAPVARPPIVVSSATGKRATVRLPPDFRKRRDLRVFWIAMILLLLVLIGFAGLRFYHTVFAR